MLRTYLQDHIRKAVQQEWHLDAIPDFVVARPDHPSHGDYATNIALTLSKTLKKSSREIAKTLIPRLAAPEFSTVEIAGPGFINFFLSPQQLAGLIKKILKEKERFGAGKKRKETVIIEYSSPNIAKPMGVHHLPTTIIGQTLVNLYDVLGYRVLALSFPGDWGTQFGALIAAYKRWGDDTKLKKDPIGEMLRLYVRFNKRAKDDEGLQEEAREEFRKLEAGDKENRQLWQRFRKDSLKDFDKIYRMLNVSIPYVFGESFFEPYLQEVITDALVKGIAIEEGDGAVIIPMNESIPPVILRKRDGATLYATRDLAQMNYRVRRWHPSKIIIVVANQQTLHFEQVFRASELLGYGRREHMMHVKFGMVLAPGGKKFATREGNLVRLQDLLEEAVKRARRVVQKLHRDLPEKEKDQVARMVGIGSVKFFYLSQNRMSDVVFDWDRMLSLKGATAPYVQYCYARIRAIGRKAKIAPVRPDFNLLTEEPELLIIRHLSHYPEIIEDAALRYEPNRVAGYLVELAEYVNAFYETVPVLSAEKSLRNARLGLLAAAAHVLKGGLGLLGIETPERM